MTWVRGGRNPQALQILVEDWLLLILQSKHHNNWETLKSKQMDILKMITQNRNLIWNYREMLQLYYCFYWQVLTNGDYSSLMHWQYEKTSKSQLHSQVSSKSLVRAGSQSMHLSMNSLPYSTLHPSTSSNLTLYPNNELHLLSVLFSLFYYLCMENDVQAANKV